MNRAGNATARPKRASRESQAAVHVSELKAFLDQLNRSLQKVEALMVALEFALFSSSPRR